MNRRNMLKGIIAGMIGLTTAAEASSTKKEVVETRTRTYIDKISLWSEAQLFDEKDENGEFKMPDREYLFIGTRQATDRNELVDLFIETTGGVWIYSPRWLIQKGHFYDLIYVEIGDKNVTAITELHKRSPGSFKKLPDCMNM